MSEEITPANAVQCAESWNFAIWAELGGGIPELVSALVTRIEELAARVKELEAELFEEGI